ncbi:MAG: hypothetical protein LBG69_05230 [Zoogloeaceae bacterium]|jgi:hypothetical protein|nr:hypothetical protein [Zoogloeaceae bacterium]
MARARDFFSPLFSRISRYAAAARRLLEEAVLLLVWDVAGLRAVIARRKGKVWRFSEEAFSQESDFERALKEVLTRLKQPNVVIPRKCRLAARFIVPSRVELPVNPARPRPAAQMREMIRAEAEAGVAESGALWTIGAVLSARGLLTPQERERVAREQALRREESGRPVYFGQTAVDLSLISKEDLRDALSVQEKLQILESALACGWTGFVEETGAPPVWLASAAGLSVWAEAEAACKRSGIKLLGALPLAWSVSEAAESADANLSKSRGVGRVALEIHPEEIMAVLRRGGRIVAARSEGRMERPLTSGGLLALVADWLPESGGALEIICCHGGDEAALREILAGLETQTGAPPVFRDEAWARRNGYACLARQRDGRTRTLPMIFYGELPLSPWKRAGFWHLFFPLLTLTLVTGAHFEQSAEIKRVQSRLDLADFESRRRSSIKRQETQAIFLARREKTELEDTRRKLAAIAPDIERLQSIEGMVNHLPQLLRALADGISDDVVLESVRNSRSGGGVGDIMITGWTTDYASAQSFALRVQEVVADLGYAVAQTEVSAGAGRGGKTGYFVSFWLLPRAGEELALESEDSKGRP